LISRGCGQQRLGRDAQAVSAEDAAVVSLLKQKTI